MSARTPKKRRALLCAMIASALILAGCISTHEAPDTRPPSSKTLVGPVDAGPAPERTAAADSKYADMNNWIRFESTGAKEADIFVIYPSVRDNANDPEDSPYFRIDNAAMRTAATGWLNRLCGSTGGFGGGYPGLLTSHTNVYAPLYRQANLYGSGGGAGMMGAPPYDDLVEAFEYYYETVNKGERPFFIYGFSQGGYFAIQLATRLLRDKPGYNTKHVATYAPGMSVAQTSINQNPALRFSRSYNDVGVITSWNSIAPSEVAGIGATSPYGTLVRNGLVTNPITWTTDTTAIPASQNKRSLAGVGLQANYCGAQAKAVGSGNYGILLILEREEAGGQPSTTNLGKYHGQDESFFYESIMDNIKDRLEAFKRGQTSILAPDRVVR